MEGVLCTPAYASRHSESSIAVGNRGSIDQGGVGVAVEHLQRGRRGGGREFLIKPQGTKEERMDVRLPPWMTDPAARRRAHPPCFFFPTRLLH
jgi:hypothetical protein